ncbi:MAG TPA: 4-hydroxy-3-methylbut-2-enyl diphosphate reductase, partial [Roseiarcus sp.]|nr:4-hydroxy-3-methylbut-2-enyl diphosphate reductase [Roseiarcus sp.]
RLREVAEREGARAQLVADAGDIDWSAIDGVGSVAVTAGASAPETLVRRVLAALDERYAIELETLKTTSEAMSFPLPRGLRETV